MSADRKRRPKGTGSIQKEKTGFYTIRARINGVAIAKSTGTKDHEKAMRMLDEFMAPFIYRDRVLAVKKLEAQVADIDRREELEEENRPKMLLRNSWWYYIDSCRRKDVGENTLEMKENVWAAFVNWISIVYEENMEVRSVTPEIADIYMRFLKKSVASSTWNNRLCYLREIYRIIMPAAKAKVNPFDGMPLVPDGCHARRELSMDEIRRLLEAASACGDEWRILFLVAIYTGLRLGDCCLLDWTKVNLERGIIQLVPIKTHRYNPRRVVTIPIHPHLLIELKRLKAKYGEVGAAPGEPSKYVLPEISWMYDAARHRVSQKLGIIFRNAGIKTSVMIEGRRQRTPEATFHSLRHTFVSLAANAGVPLVIIKSIVGHESTSMTWHYYHQDESRLKEAVAAIPSFEDVTKGGGRKDESRD